MSTTHAPIEPAIAATQPASLADLRVELDGIDDALHDLLMHRASVVGRIGALSDKGRVKLRPGREASILRRLLERHVGGMPARAAVRLWRELFAAMTAMQAPVLISVCEADPAGAARAEYIQCAREHFGALTPLRAYRTPAQAIAEVSAGTATAAVLPMPVEEERPAAAWWTALLQRDEPRIHVVARLPFWAPRPEGAPQVQALVVTVIPPDPSGQDRSLLGFELPPDMSRARLTTALAAAGFALGHMLLRRDSAAPVAYALVDVEGLVGDDDPRLAALAGSVQRPVVLGGYAVPIEEAA